MAMVNATLPSRNGETIAVLVNDGTGRGSAQSGKENGGDDTLDIHGV